MLETLDSFLPVLLDVSLRSIGLAVVAGTILYLLRVRNRNVHHRVWSMVLVAMLCMPVLQSFLPALPIELPLPDAWNENTVEAEPLDATSTTQPVVAQYDEVVQSEVASSPEVVVTVRQPIANPPLSVSTTETDAAAQTQPTTLTLLQTLVIAYVVGLLLGLVRLGIGIYKVNRIVKSGALIHPQGASEAPVLQTDSINVPLTVGVLRPVILLPRDWQRWDAEMLQSVLAHEQTHIDRRDYLVGLSAELNRCLYWFHPLAWWLRKRLATLAEHVCDDLVIAKHQQRADYAEYLLKIATRMKTDGRGNVALGVPMARTTQLESRIDAILDFARPLAYRLSWKISLLMLALAMPLIAVVAGLQADEPSGTNGQQEEVSEEVSPDNASSGEAVDFEMSKTIRVVNSDGDPVVGATVTPWAIRSAQGHGSWSTTGQGASEPPVLTTDERGAAVIPFPRYSNSAEKIRPQALTCRVEHPDYADTAYNDVPVTDGELEKIATIKLLPGALIEVEAELDGQKLSAENLFARWSDYGGGKLEADESGKIKLPRVSSGTKLLRLVYLPDDGATYFSDIEQLSLSDGDEVKLTFTMQPSLTIRGQIDDSVARPVENGKLIGQVIDVAESAGAVDNNTYSRPASLSWQVSTTIKADGSYVLEDVPPGNLQVIALCDGYRAAHAEQPPEFVQQRELDFGRGGPQVFSVDQQQTEILLKMTPTAQCKITVSGPDKQPIENATCSFWPNVTWWQGGSQVYCHPLFSSAAGMKDPELMKQLHAKHKEVPYAAKTDAQGIAVVRGLPPGSNMFIVSHDEYELSIDTSNFANGLQGVRYREANLTPGETAEVLVAMQPIGSEFLGDQAAVEPIHIPMPGRRSHIPKPRPLKQFPTQASDAQLAGVVVDELGLPLEGVSVDAWSWYPGNETFTDEEGRFRLEGFDRNGDIEVLFSKEKYSPSYFVSQPAGTDNWTIVLTKGTWLEGKVLDPEGEPIANAVVKALRGPFENPNVVIGDVTTQTESKADGTYRLHVEPDAYSIQCHVNGVGAARYDDIELSEKQKKKLDVRLDSGVTFKARVRNSVTQEPVAGFLLWNWRQPQIEGVSDANGLIEISGMMEGEFEFNVSSVDVDRRRSSVAGDYARWWSPESANEFGRERIAEGEQLQSNWDDLKFDLSGKTYEVNIFVEPLVTIKGRVLDPNGNPVQGATVAPAKTGSGNSITGDTRFSYETDANGSFTMKLPASKNAKYNLVAHDGKYQQWRTWANGVGEPMQTTPGQFIEDVELRLTRPATVRGRVTNVLGTPRAHVKVRAAAFDRRDNRYYHPEAETDADGNYELKFIRPGKHYIQIDSFWLDASQAETSTTRIVELAPDQVKEGIDFESD